jgi:hypothetical protein
MHQSAVGRTRAERVRQVREREASVRDYAAYVPVGNAVSKLRAWSAQGAELVYLSSHKKVENVEKDMAVLRSYGFPEGQVVFRQPGESYQEVVRRVLPDVLIEDDCESIGGEREMISPFLDADLRATLTAHVVKEFEGIDHLPDDLARLQPE